MALRGLAKKFKSGSLYSGITGSVWPGIGGSLWSGMGGSLWSRIVKEARKTIENNLLPLIKEAQLVRYELQVRSQYAVVLSYCGEIAAAKSEMGRLKPYTMSKQQKDEIQRQSDIIEGVASGRIVLPKSVREITNQNPHQ